MDVKWGEKRGPLRGSYEAIGENAEADNRHSWKRRRKAVAETNEVNTPTGRRWIRMNNEDSELTKQGGPRITKLSSLYVDRITDMIEENNQ